MGLFDTLIIKPYHELLTWLNGDPLEPRFDTRKTFFETLIGIFGFIAISRLVDEIDL